MRVVSCSRFFTAVSRRPCPLLCELRTTGTVGKALFLCRQEGQDLYAGGNSRRGHPSLVRKALFFARRRVHMPRLTILQGPVAHLTCEACNPKLVLRSAAQECQNFPTPHLTPVPPSPLPHTTLPFALAAPCPCSWSTSGTLWMG